MMIINNLLFKKHLTFKNILVAALVVALIYMVQFNCRRTPAKPVYVPIKEQVKVVEKDYAAMKKQSDSFQNIIKSLDRVNDETYNTLVDYMNENSQLQADMLNLSKVTPDTCAKFVLGYKNYADQTNKTLKQANANIFSLNRTISTQKDFLNAKDIAYNKMKAAWDTCIATSKTLEKYANDNKPKRELAIGVNGMAGYTGGFLPAAGLTLSYRNRKGTEFNAAIYTNQIITIGIKKPIFKF